MGDEMKKLILLFIALVFTGCATFQPSDPVFKLTVQYSVMRYVAESPERQTEAARIVSNIKGYIDTGATVTVEGLQELAVSWVPWERMHPADRILLMALLEHLSESFEMHIGTGTLKPEDMVKAKEFLRWIEQAIEMARIE